MKLRNKKTREIANLEDRGLLKSDNNNHIIVYPEGTLKYYAYNSLAELCEEWEDAPEEPKKTWFIDAFGNICDREAMTLKSGWDDKPLFEFETEEEAEKAVEKLKAWKRLKSHDLFISKGNRTFVNTDDVFVIQNVQFRVDTYGDAEEDLDLLFGGEE
jgi:hypothetical protein